MLEVRQTDAFVNWLRALKDANAVARIPPASAVSNSATWAM
jgi:putative component of toxin-antitoxin plasmid stabilization module